MSLGNTRQQKRLSRELDISYRIGPRVDGQAIQRMRARIAECRQLAAFTTDRRASKILLQMADESEADLRRFEAESGDERPSITIRADVPKATN